MPIYYWNLGYRQFQQVSSEGDKYRLLTTDKRVDNNSILNWFDNNDCPGIFILDDLVNFFELSVRQKCQRESQIQNLFWRVNSTNQYLIFLGNYLQFSEKLRANVPVLKYPLPSSSEIEAIVKAFSQQQQLRLDNKQLNRLSVACAGLRRGEIDNALRTYFVLASSPEHLAELIINFKVNQLRDLGLEFIAEPDVETAGGLDLLQEYLHKVVKLNETGAFKYNLRPPRGMLLLGPPGTGKTLSAKLAAKALGYSLLGLSWGNILGNENPAALLRKILEIADSLDRVVLLADDFDKGFTGWQEGGVSRRLSQMLLTWMNEHTSHVLMIATVNRIKLLPAELKRRFDDGGIWFVDLPDMGALYEIFQIHLAQYFPHQFGDNQNPWSDRQWYSLLKRYRGATPVEIKNAVARCATDFYCALSEEQRQSGVVEPTITLSELIAQLDQFQMASIRDSEDIMEIRNTAYYARPASSLDNSKFAIPRQELFEYKPHVFDEN